MNCFVLLASIVMAVAPPPPTPPWDQLTPGVDYEMDRIGVGLQQDLAYQLITRYFENNKVLTQTGVAELDAIGDRYGLVTIKPTFERYAYKAYWAMKRGQSDPLPQFSNSFRFTFYGNINIPAAVADYEAARSTTWVNHLPIPRFEGDSGQAPAATPQPTAAPAARLDPVSVQPIARRRAAAFPIALIVLGACACLAALTALSAGIVYMAHVLTSTRNARHK